MFSVTRLTGQYSNYWRILFSAILAAMLGLGLATDKAQAQDTAWIQVEATRSILETKEKAGGWSAKFPDTHAFLTRSGLYAIVLGPMDEAEALRQTTELIAEGRIPADSFVTLGEAHLSQLWPLAAQTETTTTATETATSDPVVTAETTTETSETSTAETVTPEPEPEPVSPIKDPDLRATQRAERQWTRDFKKEVQTWMVWTGDYTAKIDGSYGQGTRGAIRSFQEREGYEATGWLTETQVSLLQQRYDELYGPLGMTEMSNTSAGIEIMYPSGLVAFDRITSPFIHFKPATDAGVKMVLISQEGGRDMMNGLYAILETFDYVPAEGYRVQKKNWFVLSGKDETVVSYTYAKTNGDTVKGFTLIWPPENDAVMRRVATIMYESFTALDDYVLDETIGFGSDPDDKVDLLSGTETEAPLRAASGFFVNAEGHIVTHAANIAGCGRLTLDDGTELAVVSAADMSDVAVLKAAEAGFEPDSFALMSSEKPEIGVDVTVSGFSYPASMLTAVLNYGTLTDVTGPGGEPEQIRVSAFLEAGDTGGPVLDDRGAVIGMQLGKPAAGLELPEYVNFALRTAEVTARLDAIGVTWGEAKGFDSVHAVDLADMAADFTVKIACYR